MSLMEGVVVDVTDPQQMGRVKIWIPAVDGEMYKLENLPWAVFVSPLAGQTRDYPGGAEGTPSKGLVSYGWWAVPKKGALVIVGFLYGDPNRRLYMGSYFRDHGNRSLPAGRNRADIGPGPITDTLDPLQPANSNLSAQFNGDLNASEAKTRGAYERAVAQDKTIKDGVEGYQPSPFNDKEYDPQTYALTTPGRHALIFQDNPSTGRIRIKTASGQQIILDDANERIYVSTARGNSYFEMDQDGRIHVYAADSLSLSTGGDFNVTASGAINLQSGKAVNIQAGGALNLAGCSSTNISGAGVNLESSAGFNILAAGDLLQTAPNIHLNGPGAAAAACPDLPTTVPKHEPWTRAQSKQQRNKNWKK